MSIHTHENGQNTIAGPLTQLREELAQAREELATSRAETVEAVKALEDFKVRASDILAEGANDHDLCGAYDEWATRAGLLPRPFPQDVEVEVRYRQTVTFRARTWESAKDGLRDMPLASARYFSATNPYQGHDDITDVGGPYSVTVTVVDDEPF